MLFYNYLFIFSNTPALKSDLKYCLYKIALLDKFSLKLYAQFLQYFTYHEIILYFDLL